MKQNALGKNRVTGQSAIKERARKNNRIARHSKRGERMEDINGDMFEVNFFD